VPIKIMFLKNKLLLFLYFLQADVFGGLVQCSEVQLLLSGTSFVRKAFCYNFPRSNEFEIIVAYPSGVPLQDSTQMIDS
jgi:hypothetical protein